MTWARAPRGTSCSAFAPRKNLGLETAAGVAGGPEGGLKKGELDIGAAAAEEVREDTRSFVRHLCNSGN